MATVELLKTDQNCSNIYFIDENSCVADSVTTINNNITALSANLIDLVRYKDLWDSIYTNFTLTSGLMTSTILNVENINYTVNQSFSCVQSLSGNWYKDFSLFFPTMYPIDEWNGYTALQIDASVLNPWLTINFPPERFPDNQIVNIFVNTNQHIPFQFTYSRTYDENCAPNGGETTLSCEGCNSGNQGAYRNQGCNHHGGAAGYGGCDNAYSHCGGPNKKTKQTSSYTCIADSGQRLTGGPLVRPTDPLSGPLAVGLYVGGREGPIYSSDNCFARVYQYKYVKTYNYIDGAKWVSIPIV